MKTVNRSYLNVLPALAILAVAGCWGHSVVVAKTVEQIETSSSGQSRNASSAETRDVFAALRSARKAYSEFSNSPQGIYEKDDNIFVIVVINTAREKLKHVEGTAMLRSVALLRRRFPDLPDEFTTFSRVLENEQKFDSDDYRYAVLYSRHNIDKLIAEETPRRKAEAEAKLAEQAAERQKAEDEARRAQQAVKQREAEAEAKFAEQATVGHEAEAEAIRTTQPAEQRKVEEEAQLTEPSNKTQNAEVSAISTNPEASARVKPLVQTNSTPESLSEEKTGQPKKPSKGLIYVYENELL